MIATHINIRYCGNGLNNDCLVINTGWYKTFISMPDTAEMHSTYVCLIITSLMIATHINIRYCGNGLNNDCLVINTGWYKTFISMPDTAEMHSTYACLIITSLMIATHIYI